ncbi:MAG: B12-binding domain-containing radical SAM protein [Promethearchaeota archaeon]
MKFLLMTPPCIDLYEYIRTLAPKSPPLGISYIGAVLREEGYQIEILDTFALDMSWKEVVAYIKGSKADIFGATCLTSTFKEVIFMAKIAKKYHPRSIFIVGGSHPTADPIGTLESTDIDIAVIGEGEETVRELAGYISQHYNFNRRYDEQDEYFYEGLKGIDGIAFKYIRISKSQNGGQNGGMQSEGTSVAGGENQMEMSRMRVIRNKDRALIKNLDDIPYPAYDLLPMHKYNPPPKFPYILPYTAIFTMRGCPYNCTFCAANIVWKRRVRFRSIENVKKELEILKSKYKIRYIWLNDSTFTIRRDFALKVMKLLKEFDIKWACNTRVDYVSPALLKIMAYYGCNVIEYGFESGDNGTLRLLRKGITTEQIRRAVKWTRDAGILISGAFMMGLPNENRYLIKKTLEFAREINPDAFSLSILTPYPGTEIYKVLKEEKGLKIDFRKLKDPKHMIPIIDLPDMTSRELSNLWLKANLRYYFRLRYIKQLIIDSIRIPSMVRSILLDLKSGIITFLRKIMDKIF